MTETTTTLLEPPAVPNPTNILLDLIVALLAPMFLCVAGGDIEIARAAATETVNAYRARNHADLITVAQIVAFGLAALGSLSLSMADDISLSMALRLRGNANACNRSGEQNRRALDQSQAAQPAADPAPNSDPDEYPTHEALAASVAAAQKLAAEVHARAQANRPATRQPPHPPQSAMTMPLRSQAWATAMIDAAEKINATLGSLPPDQRRSASLRAATLTTTASGLLGGIALQPAVIAPPS